MTLSPQNIRALRAAAHKLKPVVLLGKGGVSDAVLAEINVALDHHELIKVKVRAEDRDDRKMLITEIVEKTAAELVQTIGTIAVLYRQAPDNVKKKPARAAAPRPKRPTPSRTRW